MAITIESINYAMRNFSESTSRRLRGLDLIKEAVFRLEMANRLSSRTKDERRAKRAARRMYDDAWRAYNGRM
jgi:hypothetical protein